MSNLSGYNVSVESNSSGFLKHGISFAILGVWVLNIALAVYLVIGIKVEKDTELNLIVWGKSQKLYSILALLFCLPLGVLYSYDVGCTINSYNCKAWAIIKIALVLSVFIMLLIMVIIKNNRNRKENKPSVKEDVPDSE